MTINTHLNENHLNTGHFNFTGGELSLANPPSSSGLVKHFRAIIDFETTSPATIGTMPAHSIVTRVTAKTTTAWNGNAPTIDVGITGSTFKYLYSGDYSIGAVASPYTVHIHERETSETAVVVDIFPDGSTAGVTEIYFEYAVV